MSIKLDVDSRRYFNLTEVPEHFASPKRKLRVLMLADDKHPAQVVLDHIYSFREHSMHHITVVNTRHIIYPKQYDSLSFDILLIHYSIFVLAETYLSKAWQEFISSFRGVVAIIHEDEYQKINAFKQKFSELGVRAVFSCLDSIDTLKKVYGSSFLLQDTLFFSCLPGYIPLSLKKIKAPPIRKRQLHVIYRGRNLPPELGRFAQEKRIIGEKMQAIADAAGLRSDISSAEEDRIYGTKWLKFLTSGKAMIGVEGGASIFDFDDQLRTKIIEYRELYPNAPFDEIWNVLAEYEGNIDFRTITPKFFEAIAAKTVLVLYPGKYRGILIADRDYIPLERDGSNAYEVVAKLKDDRYLQDMADRTYSEILDRFDLASSFYIHQIDRVLWHLIQINESLKREVF